MPRKLFATLLCLSVAPLIPLGAQPAPAPDALRQINEGLIGIFERVSPAVVVIEVDRSTPVPDPPAEKEKDKEEKEEGEDINPFEFFFRDPHGRGRKAPFSMPEPFRAPQEAEPSEGSGFILREDGHILTNHHVVAEARKVSVKLKDGRTFEAKIIGNDDKTDLAVIKIEAKGLPTIELADSSKVRVGQLVCAIGTPLRLDYTFTVGVVSATGRDKLRAAVYEEYIQTDASINPGNSGGPLLDIEGRAIGVNTLINGINRGLGFAIPSNMAREVSDQLIANGRIQRPWLGVKISDLAEAVQRNPQLKSHLGDLDSGVLLETIEPDTPAYGSDLRPLDVITKVDGVKVATARELQKEILKKKIGQKIELAVQRGKNALSIPVTTGEMPDDPERAAKRGTPRKEPAKPAPSSLEDYGLQTQDLTAELAERLKLQPRQGVLVTGVAPNSPADIAGLQEKDVITEADDQPVASVAELKEILSKADAKRGALLFVDRGGGRTYAVLKPATK